MSSKLQLDVVTTVRGGAMWWMRTKAKGRHGVVCRLNCVIHVWAPWEQDTCNLGCYVNPGTVTFTFTSGRHCPTFKQCMHSWHVVQHVSDLSLKSHIAATAVYTSHQSITLSEWSYHCGKQSQCYEAGLLQHCPCNSSTSCNFKSQLQSLVKRSVTSTTNACEVTTRWHPNLSQRE